MKDQLIWDLNQTWPVGQKWRRYTNAPQISARAHPKKFGTQKQNLWPLFSRLPHSTLQSDRIYLEQNVASTDKNASVNLQCHCVPKSWPTFYDLWLWPRNGWDPFAHCDPPFGGHYATTIIVATCLVSFSFLKKLLSKEKSRSTSTGPIFTKFSPYGRHLIVDCQLDPPFNDGSRDIAMTTNFRVKIRAIYFYS